ncbi:hypothetical protein OPV22_009041 [Ensete ventricosum]|uniref:Uncharacterized protein n=1 Tax=Ensete ventricosum TaxID=4639 RepID=A0AAV8PR94_ENSVE|nr:hypothetical protein OPV22_009041 [Ensete ventricosum]
MDGGRGGPGPRSDMLGACHREIPVVWLGPGSVRGPARMNAVVNGGRGSELEIQRTRSDAVARERIENERSDHIETRKGS